MIGITIFGQDLKSWSFWLNTFLQPPASSYLSGTNTFCHTLLSNTFNLCDRPCSYPYTLRVKEGTKLLLGIGSRNICVFGYQRTGQRFWQRADIQAHSVQLHAVLPEMFRGSLRWNFQLFVAFFRKFVIQDHAPIHTRLCSFCRSKIIVKKTPNI